MSPLYCGVIVFLALWNNVSQKLLLPSTVISMATKSISSSIRKRNYHFKRAKHFGRPDQFYKYKKMRNRVTSTLRKMVGSFSFRTLTSTLITISSFWKATKYLHIHPHSLP